MRCLLPLLVLLGAAHAGPFFRLRFGSPEHRSDPEGGVELPPSELSQLQPEQAGAVFALRLPQIDLSDIFRPLRVFAGVNVNHQSPIGVREEGPNCDEAKFELTDDEFDVVMDCQELVGNDEVELKECILTKLPKTTAELRDFLDREEFGVADLSSSFHLAVLREFTQKRSVQFRLCPRDEVNSIDGEELVPAAEQMVPIEVLGGPDRVDQTGPVFSVVSPEAMAPPHRPLFQFPELRLPDFGQIFTQAFAPVFGGPPPPPAEKEDAGLGLFGTALNPFALRQPPAVAGPQQGFFASLFPALAATPPPQGPPEDIDMSDCASKKFEVPRFVFNVANRCQYANDYRKCLRLDLAGDENADELLQFAADPAYSVVASSFSSFQTTFDLEALHSGRGLLDMARKNQIDLRRCANIVKKVTTEAATEETASVSEPAPEATEEADSVSEPAPEATEEAASVSEPASEATEEAASVSEPAPEATEEAASVSEPAPEATEEAASVSEPASEATGEAASVSEPAPEATEGASALIEVDPEEMPIVPEVYPEQPAPAAEVIPEEYPEQPAPAAEVIQEEYPEQPSVTAQVLEAAPEAEAPEEKSMDSEKSAVEAEKATVKADATVEADKAPVEAEKAPEGAEKAPVDAEKAPMDVEAAVEEEKATVEGEKAAAGVENPAEESKTIESNDNVQAFSAYDAASAEP